jgi:hypothetical protein
MIAENPLLEITRSADHRYRYRGTWYPGVTSILKVLDKSGPLMAWAARNTAEAAVSQIDALPHLLQSVGPEGVVRALTARSEWKRDEAADLGTAVHEYADLIARGQPLPPLPAATVTRVEAYADWWKNSKWRLRSSESMLVNTEMQYGGTLDLLAYDADGRTVLADVKTGKGVYREAVLQLAAYGNATLIQTATGLYAMPKVDRYVVLHVTADGVREIEINVGALEMLAWAACRDLHDWSESMKGKKL